MLMATITTPDGEIEAEPITVEMDGKQAVLTLDDGTTVYLDLNDLLDGLIYEHRQAA